MIKAAVGKLPESGLREYFLKSIAFFNARFRGPEVSEIASLPVTFTLKLFLFLLFKIHLFRIF